MESTKSKFNKLLKSKEYSFFDKEPCLKDLIFVTVGGSHAYGTNIETSDFDCRGVVFNSEDTLLGLNNFSQFEDKTTDTVIYSLNRFAELCINCNPNIIELLGLDNHFTEEEKKNGNTMYFIQTQKGKWLVENSSLFLSKKAFYTFTGYATSQLRRLENNLARHTIEQPKKEEHILNSMNNLIYSLNERYEDFGTKNTFDLYIDESNKTELEKEIYFKGNFEGYPLRDFKSLINEFSNVIKEYEKINHRNKKKDELHLNKHMMHLIRLYLTGIDILEKEIIITNRRENHDLLMDIRNGKFLNKDGTLNSSFMDIVKGLEKKMNYAKENTSLQDKCNYKAINEMLVSMNVDNIIKDKGYMFV